MPNVAILLCTFNGARFLPAQLASFADQSWQDWQLFASDDGSKDDTVSVLTQYQQTFGPARMQIRNGPRQGFVINFLSLVCDPSIAADYFAYSDQDDVWEPEKLARAVEVLTQIPPQIPAVFGSRTRLIDYDGRVFGLSPLFRHKPDFRNALVQSIAGGNTMVFNAAAREHLIVGGAQLDLPGHDWWTYLVTTAVGGHVHYEPTPLVRYRVHPNNVMGSNAGVSNHARRLQMVARGRFREWIEHNIAALKPLRSRMTAENRATFDLFCESRDRPFIGRQIGLLKTGIYRQTMLGNLGLIAASLLKLL
jgi:glycosyltransferase involved in cell wall biosynthesis